MKYSDHRKLLCELSKLSKFNTDERRCIYSCLQIPPRENWFQYVLRVYATAINFPCIQPWFHTSLFTWNVCYSFWEKHKQSSAWRALSPNLAIRTFCKHMTSSLTYGEKRPLSAKTNGKPIKIRLCADTYNLGDIWRTNTVEYGDIQSTSYIRPLSWQDMGSKNVYIHL